MVLGLIAGLVTAVGGVGIDGGVVVIWWGWLGELCLLLWFGWLVYWPAWYFGFVGIVKHRFPALVCDLVEVFTSDLWVVFSVFGFWICCNAEVW